jgi:hypothetical protein
VGARRYSKAFELEADALGTVIAARAGYDPLRGCGLLQPHTRSGRPLPRDASAERGAAAGGADDGGADGHLLIRVKAERPEQAESVHPSKRCDMLWMDRFDKHADLVGRMAETLGVDLGEQMMRGSLPPTDMRSAVMACMGCKEAGDCVTWLEAHAEGSDVAPSYCRNKERLQALTAL